MNISEFEEEILDNLKDYENELNKIIKGLNKLKKLEKKPKDNKDRTNLEIGIFKIKQASELLNTSQNNLNTWLNCIKGRTIIKEELIK